MMSTFVSLFIFVPLIFALACTGVDNKSLDANQTGQSNYREAKVTRIPVKEQSVSSTSISASNAQRGESLQTYGPVLSPTIPDVHILAVSPISKSSSGSKGNPLPIPMTTATPTPDLKRPSELKESEELRGQLGELIMLQHDISVDGKSDVNINSIKEGPLGYLYGSTEENGYIFILDPGSDSFLIFDAGRKRGDPFSGDITDFIVYMEDNQIVIIALQAYPAEIYKIYIDTSHGSFPTMKNVTEYKVFSNNEYKRFMAIARSDEGVLAVGTYGPAAIFISFDKGVTWRKQDILSILSSTGLSDVDSVTLDSRISSASSINSLLFTDGRLLASLYHLFIFENKLPWTSGYRNFINAVVYSDDLENWTLSVIETDQEILDLHTENIYEDSLRRFFEENMLGGLIGEAAQTLTYDEIDNEIYFATGMDNEPVNPYGGRILKSIDYGKTFKLYDSFPHTDTILGFVSGGQLGIGTFTKLSEARFNELNLGQATGGMYLCNTFNECFYQKIVETNSMSAFRNNIYVIGVSALVKVNDEIYIGTVDESSQARLFKLFLKH